MALGAASASAGGVDIVQNGGFQSLFTGWSYSTSWSPATVVADPGAPVDTPNAAQSWCGLAACNDPATGSDISQALSTEASQTYTLTFFYDAGVNPTGVPSELDVFWNSISIPVDTIIDATPETWAEYTVSGLTATGSLTALEFTGRQDVNSLEITDISVTADSSAAPEPESMTLIGCGLLAMMGTVLRRRCRV